MKPDTDEVPNGAHDAPGWVALLTMGTTSAGCVAVGIGLGVVADHWWHCAPVGFLVGLVLGFVAAVVSVIRLVRHYF